MGASPVCAAFTIYEGAVSNCINAALHAHESEKGMVFYKECLKDLEEAKKHLRKAYAEQESAVSRTERLGRQVKNVVLRLVRVEAKAGCPICGNTARRNKKGISMTETACFIHDRAISLGYKARRFPKVAPQACAWLRLAVSCCR